MSSISDSIPFVPAYQPAGKHPIDNDVPRTNPLDKQAGEDAEVSNGKGGWKSIGNATRDHANRTRLDRNFLPSDKKIVDDSRVNTHIQYHGSGTLPAFSTSAGYIPRLASCVPNAVERITRGNPGKIPSRRRAYPRANRGTGPAFPS